MTCSMSIQICGEAGGSESSIRAEVGASASIQFVRGAGFQEWS